MKRIKENELEKYIKNLNFEKAIIQIIGLLEQKINLENVNVNFDNEKSEIIFKDNENSIKLKMSYVEEIYIKDKTLVFYLENDLKIIIKT